VLLALTGLASSQKQQPDPHQKRIVDRYFPNNLEGGLTANSCFAVYDWLPNGNPRTIMAGYSDGVSGAIRVIRANTSGHYKVIFDAPAEWDVSGIDCSVVLKDVDGDKKNEVIFSFHSFKMNSGDWVFRWTGSQLVNLAPDMKEFGKTVPGVFFNMELVDFYHDGTLQVLDGANTHLRWTEAFLRPEPSTGLWVTSSLRLARISTAEDSSAGTARQ
jgi:hypothetical protein